MWVLLSDYERTDSLLAIYRSTTVSRRSGNGA